MDRHASALAYALKVLKQEKYKQYIREIYLFGSCARGEQKYHSDVDLFVRVLGDTPQRVLVTMRSEVIPDDPTLPEVDLKISTNETFGGCKHFCHNLEREAELLWKKT